MKTIGGFVLRLGVSSLIVVGASFTTPVAHADSVPSPSSKCETTMRCSSGQAALKASSRDIIITSIDSGWLPACSNGNAHCSGTPLQVRTDVALGPTDDPNKPLWEVDMLKGALIDVTWPDKESFTLKLANGALTDGQLTVAHSVIPNASVYVGLILNQEFNFNATDLLNKAPGANFKYASTATANFMPWAADTVAQLTVPGPDLSQSELFSVPLQSMPGVGSLLEGTLALSLSTSPTFSYTTTQVQISGVTRPLTGTNPAGKLKTQNADYLDLLVDVQGELTVKGTMEFLPNAHITHISGIGSMNLTLPINVGANKDYTNEKTPVLVQFPKATVHVPLPNLFVPTEDVDFGEIKTGSQAEKSVDLNNTGELGAILSIESSDPQFSIAAPQAQMNAKSKGTLVVRFAPTQEGPASATITVTSNDPDSPVQTFNVTGSSRPEAAPVNPQPTGGPPPVVGSPSETSGCGCHMAPQGTQTAGLAFVGLGIAALVRRRRR
jgi:MYXO-CTERM domain-containing protein